ncbi:hypothetical protein BUY98_14615 [Staphylococcus gallinarum]|uniref:hypothetical protein n=1 Tax=Staphylococcus gallinarum TaxID=1293 RepID=UPI000E6A7457|nr:hypothetical protein [Staphylococcus gallinarum]RIL21567.1 hypothetical protein BUY97_12210 [Staphylococcus gallinarum]RIL23767.1 hypothetical protein BUY99_04180 [Staphylococcus gallinarum]RIL27139.1 hypothetical protein BUY98_14615 [Staphylococcus gallinarum]RIL29805.1 hypothetical protein BUY95_03850 [Staphylococcus gallinarum]
MDNTVTIDLETYNELFYKANKYDELKKENKIIVNVDKWNEMAIKAFKHDVQLDSAKLSKTLNHKSKMNSYNNGGLL